MFKKSFLALPLALALGGTANAQKAPDEVLQSVIAKDPSSVYLTQSEMNIMMMPDSPALFTAEDGEKLFHAARGPNNVSMKACDFGKGPGVLKGAYVEMPRYFKDTDKVMDLETRIVHCMTEVQGFAADDPAVRQRHGSASDHMKIQTYIALESNGMEWNNPLKHPLEAAMRDAGEVMFARRAGKSDFNCYACHGEVGKQVRASRLPATEAKEEWNKAISWPAFRVGQNNVRSSQHRVRGCYYQMRQAGMIGGSDASIAMISYWTDLARGQTAILPDMKR